MEHGCNAPPAIQRAHHHYHHHPVPTRETDPAGTRCETAAPDTRCRTVSLTGGSQREARPVCQPWVRTRGLPPAVRGERGGGEVTSRARRVGPGGEVECGCGWGDTPHSRP